MNATESARWLRIRRTPSSSTLRLVCLPYAGGGATIFHAWPGALPNVEVCVVQLPARQDRLSEPSIKRIDQIVDRLVTALSSLPPAPTALYGHSFGAIVAYELAQRLQSRGAAPVSLIVGARAAPHVLLPPPPLHALPDAEFCEILHRRYATPAALLTDPQLQLLVLPSLRADFEALETYVHQPTVPLNVPVTVLSGQADATLSAENAAAWARVSSFPVTLKEVDAGHFFMDTHRDWVLEQVRQTLAPFAAQPEQLGNTPPADWQQNSSGVSAE